MIRLTLDELVTAVSGNLLNRANHDANTLEVTGSVETDSRLVGPGSVFFAKPGEFTDGHNFVAAAQDAGAVVAVVEREVSGVTIPQILVSNVVLALGELAKYVLAEVRKSGQLKVIGITGSNGKTTTKNMLRAILSTSGETVAPIESYNNEVGAPISVLKVSRETRFLVAELGADGLGSIAYLAKMIQPDIAVELKVGMAHAGEFGGIETTAEIKAELLKEISSDSISVLNADDTYVRQMAIDVPGKAIWFGTQPGSDYWAENYELTIDGTGFDLHWPSAEGANQPELSRVQLQILGEHHVMNALASAAVADQLGIPRAAIVKALQDLPLAEKWRMQLTHTADGMTVINDAYNASPDSTKAALQTLAQLGRQTGRRTVAILGEMAELGEFARTEHDAIGRTAVRLNIDLVIAIGEKAKLIYMGANLEGSYDGESQYIESLDGALATVRGMLRRGDIVLVKSSKSANLRHLGDNLLEVNA